jgi:single-strand DNA-binding protein
MANLNKVMIIGNVTRDPEIKYTPQGKAVTDVSIAVNRSYKVGEEKREEVTYVDVTLWGRTAETAAEYCKKGRAVYIEGRLQLDSWEDKTSGQKRNKLRVVGEDYQLLDRRPGGAGSAGGSGGGDEEYSERPPARREAPSSGGGFSSGRNAAPQPPIEEDDIPF